MEIIKKERASGNVWRFAFSIGFLLLFAFLIVGLMAFNSWFYDSEIFWDAPLGVFDFSIIVLATFRMTRLLTYDSIMLWFRDFFWICREEKDKTTGIVYVLREKPRSGFKRTVADLLSCPWCIGVWLALLAVVIYYLGPIGRVFILVLAVAGLSSFLQIAANLIGWQAEAKKMEVEKNH